MKYSRFETLIMTGGALTVLANIMLMRPTQATVEEVVAQMLLLVVLGGAVHWGRKGGIIATIAVSGVYLVLRIPLILQTDGFSADIAQLLAVRVLTYGIIGILGGELCGRLKYLFARLEDSCNVDAESGLYNQRFLVRVLDSWIGQHQRYGVTFSLILLDPPADLFGDLKPAHRKTRVRALADMLRNDIRLVDEAGRLQDGRFVLVLPHTPAEGAAVVGDRLRDRLSTWQPLAGAAGTLTVTCLSTAVDIEALCTLKNMLSEGIGVCD